MAAAEVSTTESLTQRQQRAAAARIAELTGRSLLDARIDVAVAGAVADKERPGVMMGFELLKSAWHETVYEVAQRPLERTPPVQSIARFTALLPHSGIAPAGQNALQEAFMDRCTEPTSMDWYAMGQDFNAHARQVEADNPGVYLSRDF